jgi:hypothetical protein
MQQKQLLQEHHFRLLEEDFAVSETRTASRATSANSGASGRPHILPLKKINNVSIMLKNFKMTPKQVCHAITSAIIVRAVKISSKHTASYALRSSAWELMSDSCILMLCDHPS